MVVVVVVVVVGVCNSSGERTIPSSIPGDGGDSPVG